MFIITKKLALWIATIMIVVGLTVPHVCLADVSVASAHQVSAAEKHHSDQDSKSKAADNCCAASHCCVAKVISHAASTWMAPSSSKMTMTLPLVQNPMGHIPQGLERPPKSLV